jgi:hypothetical protein
VLGIIADGGILRWMQEFLDRLQSQNTCYTRTCNYKADKSPCVRGSQVYRDRGGEAPLIPNVSIIWR